MTDEMARLGRMVDEAVGEVGALAHPSRGLRTAPSKSNAVVVVGGGANASYQAVEDVCWLYRDGDLAENLRRRGWREARRRVARQGPLSEEWISHRGKPPVRPTRRGVEVKLEDGVRTASWEKMQSQIRARRT